MKHGFTRILLAGVAAMGLWGSAYGAGPIILGLPDVQIGDLEDSAATTPTLEFPNAYNINDYVSDDDTPDNNLRWTFGESSGISMPEYSINGVTAINLGTAAIIADDDAGNPAVRGAPPEKRFNAFGISNLTFRDIALSPTTSTVPYDEPTTGEREAAAAGKVLRFYVVDPEGNLAKQDVVVNSVIGGSDMLTGTDGYDQQVVDAEFSTDEWENSGIPTSDVSAQAYGGALGITVAPSDARYRIYGWANPSLLPYDAVGKSKFVRGKFYVNATNSFFDPVNEVPNFRLRITHENVVNAAVHYEYSRTGYTAPSYEPYYATVNDPEAELRAGYWIRPSDDFGAPSLYRVDFDPIDVPAAQGSTIGALMESYAVSDTANGTLFLRGVVLSTYDALTTSDGELLYDYEKGVGLVAAPPVIEPPPVEPPPDDDEGGDPGDGVAFAAAEDEGSEDIDYEINNTAGGPKVLSGGQFNHEANGTPGRLPALELPANSGGGFGFIAINDMGEKGIVCDSLNVKTDVFGIALANFSSKNTTQTVRLTSGTIYQTRFYATAPVPTSSEDATDGEAIQGGLRFRFQTASGCVSYLLDMTSLAVTSYNSEKTPEADDIAREALPGIGCKNPDTDSGLDVEGETGGWYSVIASSLLDPEGIRFDTGDDFYTFGDAPGPGVDTPVSAKDALFGVDLIQYPARLRVSPTEIVPFAKPNRAYARISAVQVIAYPAIDDGGYLLDSTAK